MAIKLEIPTALRPFTGKQASVEFERGHGGRGAAQVDGNLCATCASISIPTTAASAAS